MDPQQQPTSTPNNPQPSPAPTEPSTSKTPLIIAIVVIAALVIIGIIVFTILGANNKTDSNTSSSASTSQNSNSDSNPNPDKYQKYSVTDKVSGATFSVLFYKNAKVEEKNGRTYLNSGEAGSMYSVYLGVATGDKIDCGNSSTTKMTLTGESTTVCYAADNTQYAGYAKTKTGAIKINLAGQTAISMDEAKTIMESVSF